MLRDLDVCATCGHFRIEHVVHGTGPCVFEIPCAGRRSRCDCVRFVSIVHVTNRA